MDHPILSWSFFLFQEQLDDRYQGVRFYRRKIEDQIIRISLFVFCGEMINLSFREKYFAGIMQELCILHPAAHARETQMSEGISEQMQIQAAAVHALGISAVCRSSKFRFGHGAAINGTAVVLHPVGIDLQRLLCAVIQIAAGGRTDVHNQVATVGDGVDQHPDEHLRGFPGELVAVVAPGAGKGLAGLPGDQLPGLGVAEPVGRLELLGGPQVLLQLSAVVDDDLRLDASGQLDQLLRLPVVLPPSQALSPSPWRWL